MHRELFAESGPSTARSSNDNDLCAIARCALDHLNAQCFLCYNSSTLISLRIYSYDRFKEMSISLYCR